MLRLKRQDMVQSEGDDSEQLDAKMTSDKTDKRDHKKKAGKMFGKEHVNVVYEEQRVEVVDEQENRQKLIVWRERAKTICPFICRRNEEKNRFERGFKTRTTNERKIIDEINDNGGR